MSNDFTFHTGPDAPVWQLQTHLKAKHPTQATIPGVDNFAHGTFVSDPYFMFVSTAKGPLLVSDLGLVADLIYTGPNSGPNRGAKFAVSPRAPMAAQFGAFTNVVLSYNDAALGKQLGFTITGTSPDFALLPSGPPGNADWFYVMAKSNKDAGIASGMNQTWGDVFTHKPFGLDILTRAFNIKVMDIDDFQNPRTSGLPGDLDHIRGDKNALQLPDPGSKDYDSAFPIPVPWGWRYTSRSETKGSKSSRMMSTSADVVNSTREASGFHVKASIEAEIGPVEASAEFSYAKNHAMTNKIQNISAQETTTTESTVVETEYALTVDKKNATLDPDFRVRVEQLAATFKANKRSLTDDQLDNFFDEWGTHWAYSATFGAKGKCTETYSKETVRQLVANEVDVSSEWSAGASVKVFGVGGSVEGGHDHGTDTSNQSARDRVRSELFESVSCVGGGACHGGEPGSGSDRPPIYLDLRPITELLAPPFFKDTLTTVTLRKCVTAGLDRYGFEAESRTNDPARSPALQAFEIDVGAFTVAWEKGFAYMAQSQVPIKGALTVPPLIVAKGPGFSQIASVPSAFDLPQPGSTFTVLHSPKTPVAAAFNFQIEPGGDPATGSVEVQIDLSSTEPQPVNVPITTPSTAGAFPMGTMQAQYTVRPVDLGSLMGATG